MARTTRWVEEYRSLGVLLFVAAVLTAAVMSSCGGGGGGADGGLCSQCGDDPDGPCLPAVEITPGNGVHCANPARENDPSCTVFLRCRRKSDSSQQRCYPVAPGDPNNQDVDYQVRCDGSRPGGTPRPQPSGTPSVTPSTAATATLCGNGVVDLGEECDGSNVNGLRCEDFGCTTPLTGGGLACTSNCVFSFGGCGGTCTRR
jgi:hypothetical protein